VRSLIYAHRGASVDFAEGSREAYLGAIEQNADGFECDVRLTHDGGIFCWHDDDTSRLTNKTFNVAQTSTAELLSLEINYKGNRGAPILLDELLDISIRNKKHLLIETKHPVKSRGAIENAVLKLLKSREHDIKESGIHINIMSFSYFAMARVALQKEYPAVFLSKIATQVKLLRSPAPVYGLNKDLFKNDPSLFKRLRRMKKKIYVWTVDDPADMRMCAENGVTAIITNTPGQAKKVLGYS
jgi:glycerophosphoryl diester phosphodiesterase